jgi:excisionase family DNA binding protein
MSTANSEPRQSGAAEGSVRQSSQLDQLRLPLVFSVEEAADRLGVGRTLMYSLVSSGAVESVRIGRLRRVPADALVTFLNELRRGIGAGPG